MVSERIRAVRKRIETGKASAREKGERAADRVRSAKEKADAARSEARRTKAELGGLASDLGLENLGGDRIGGAEIKRGGFEAFDPFDRNGIGEPDSELVPPEEPIAGMEMGGLLGGSDGPSTDPTEPVIEFEDL